VLIALMVWLIVMYSIVLVLVRHLRRRGLDAA
jgi:hypothetical protein